MLEYHDELIANVSSRNDAVELTRLMGDYCGYVRQAAIERAVVLCNPDLLPAIVDRLNDWVPQVKHAAQAALATLLPVVAPKHVIAVLPQIARLRNSPRSNHLEWLAQFERDMIKHVPVDNLLAGARGPDVKVARTCFDILRRLKLVGSAPLVDLGLASRDDIMLAVQAAQMIESLAVEERARSWHIALASSFGAVRTIALRGVLAQPDEPSLIPLAISFLANPQTSVRLTATSFLLAHQFDVRSYYRHLLETPLTPAPLLRICLAALAGLRNPDDIELVIALSSHQVASVRNSAYVAWLKLEPKAKDDIACIALADDAARARKTALDMTRRAGAYIPFEFIVAALVGRRDWPLLLLFGELEKWNGLEAISRIAIATQASDKVRPVLRDALCRWIQTAGSFTRPSATQLLFFRESGTLAAVDGLADLNNDWAKVLDQELSIAMETRSL